MRLIRPTLTRQIVFGYLILALFSLSAVAYALNSLRDQVNRADNLVQIDIRAQNLLRSLRSSLLGEERLTRQYQVLGQPDLLPPLAERLAEFRARRDALAALEDEQFDPQLATAGRDYLAAGEEFLQAGRNSGQKMTAKLRDRLAETRRLTLLQLNRNLAAGAIRVDQTLQLLGRESRSAYKITLVLVICGMLLAAIVAVSLRLYINASLQKLARMIRDVASGSFDIKVDDKGHDEFSLLAREFQSMATKLRELEQLQLDANPLTRLPGNLAIAREIEQRIKRGGTFAHAFADLDNFKVYNDRYGYQRGSDVINLTGTIIREVVEQYGDPGDTVGHIGGDDYIFLTRPELAEQMAAEIIARFDRVVPDCYSAADREAGFFYARDRFGEERRFPLLSISIAIVCSDNFEHPTAALIGRECARMKEHLKNQPGSIFLIDRRRGQ